MLNCSNTNLKVREDGKKGIFVQNLTEHYVGSEEEVTEFLHIGNQNREVAMTMMNAESSRSHSIFIITVKVYDGE